MAYRKIRPLFLVYIFILLATAGIGQVKSDIIFTNIDDTDGLPNNSINAIAKDELGFIWLGTSDGLCRYEGPNEIKTFRADSPRIEGGLESSNIRSLLLDRKKNLWIGTRLGGLTRFHQPSGTWKTYRKDTEDSTSLSSDEILTITEDRQGRIWIGTEDGLNVYNYDTDSFFSFTTNDEKKSGALPAKAVLSVFEDDKGWIWVGTWDGGLSLLCLPSNGNIEQGQFLTFFPNEKKPAGRVWEIYQDNQDRYWLGTAGAGLFLMQLPPDCHDAVNGPEWRPKFHNYSKDGSNYGLTNDDIKEIRQDRNGNLWIATVNGLNCILANDLKDLLVESISSTERVPNFYHYFYDPSNSTSLSNSNVRCLFEDDQGIIWAGTYGGVSQYNWAANQFDSHELSTDLTKNPLFQNLYIDPDGVAWYGNGEKGILKYDFENGKKQHLSSANSFVTALYSPDDKQLYFGCRKGIGVLEMKTDKLKYFPIFSVEQQQGQHIPIRSLYKDDQNRVWVGTEHGLFVIFEETGDYKLFSTDLDNPTSISDNTINQIYEDSKGAIWLATFQGLNRVIPIKPDEFEFESFKHDASDPDNSIPSNRIISMIEVDQVLYIATWNGLSGYDLNEKNFFNCSKNNNKYSFQSIAKTKDDNIWGSTTEGIVHYNTQLGTFTSYGKGDGLGDAVFHQRSSFVDDNGWIYFGSQRGITRFDPLNISKNETPPPVYITDIRKMSPKGEVLSNATYQKELILEPNEYYLSLNFAALNYSHPEKNQYAFMLEGLDEKWNYTDKKAPAIYTNLKYGTYQFKVKAANNDGLWNEVGASLTIIKKPAFVETWWFYFGCLVVSLGLILLGVKLYTRNIKARNKRLLTYNEGLNREIEQRKLAEEALQKQQFNLRLLNANLERSNKDLEQFAYIASHDLQEPLRVVGNFVGLLKHQYREQLDENAFQYIDFAVDGVSRMSEQIKSILTFSKVSQNDIVLQLTNLNEVISTVLHDLSQEIEERSVQITMDPLPEIYCDRGLIKMVFHNLISNAIKFNKSEKPFITISSDTNRSTGFWQFFVKDNGIGIHEDFQLQVFEIFKRLHNKKDYEGTGIGLALCQKIIHRHGGEIWLESEEGIGTTLYFTIKMSQPAQQDEGILELHPA